MFSHQSFLEEIKIINLNLFSSRFEQCFPPPVTAGHLSGVGQGLLQFSQTFLRQPSDDGNDDKDNGDGDDGDGDDNDDDDDDKDFQISRHLLCR